MFKSIQSKIILLFVLGSLLACVLSGIGFAVDRFKTAKMTVSGQSQQLALQLAEQMLREEQFISHHDPDLIPRIQAAEDEFAITIARLRQDVGMRSVQEVITPLINANEARHQVFTQIVRHSDIC